VHGGEQGSDGGRECVCGKEKIKDTSTARAREGDIQRERGMELGSTLVLT
jgi:hypothetical protein